MINLKDLLKAGVHFGHKTSRWSPKMKPFIWGSKNKIHLIDIAKTSFLLERAGKFLNDVASQGKCILFIGTKKAAQKTIFDIASRLKLPYVTNRWIGGTLTNFDQVKKAITRLLHLRDVVKKPTEHYKKKELSMIQKEIERLEKNIGGILDLSFPPGAIVVVDAKKERSAIREAINANIPIVSLVDTNTNPEGINFVIPANDDSPRSITFILEYLATIIENGQKNYIASKKTEKDTKKEITKKAKDAAKTTKTSNKEIEKVAPKKVELLKKGIEKEEAAPKTKTTEKKATDEKKEVKITQKKTTTALAEKVKKEKTENKKAEPKKTTKKEVTTKEPTKKSTSGKKTITKKATSKKTTKK
ncbi:30S ribosomal protein S2 [Candidatus Dependentiae bacterium]|nr:30S ribosomal protein S2 [Candidatus Dependentiae bacterium]